MLEQGFPAIHADFHRNRIKIFFEILRSKSNMLENESHKFTIFKQINTVREKRINDVIHFIT